MAGLLWQQFVQYIVTVYPRHLAPSQHNGSHDGLAQLDTSSSIMYHQIIRYLLQRTDTQVNI